MMNEKDGKIESMLTYGMFRTPNRRGILLGFILTSISIFYAYHLHEQNVKDAVPMKSDEEICGPFNELVQSMVQSKKLSAQDLRSFFENYQRVCDDKEKTDQVAHIVVKSLVDDFIGSIKLIQTQSYYKMMTTQILTIYSGDDALKKIVTYADTRCPSGAQELCDELKSFAQISLGEADISSDRTQR